MLNNEPFPELDKNLELIKFVLSTNQAEKLLAMQDIGYGNNLLHIAVSLHSVKTTELLASYKSL